MDLLQGADCALAATRRFLPPSLTPGLSGVTSRQSQDPERGTQGCAGAARSLYFPGMGVQPSPAVLSGGLRTDHLVSLQGDQPPLPGQLGGTEVEADEARQLFPVAGNAACSATQRVWEAVAAHCPSGGLPSPLLLLGALGQRLQVELQHVPAVLIPAEVPLRTRREQRG